MGMNQMKTMKIKRANNCEMSRRKRTYEPIKKKKQKPYDRKKSERPKIYLSNRPVKVTRHMSLHEYLWLQCDTFADYGTILMCAKTLGQQLNCGEKLLFGINREHENTKPNNTKKRINIYIDKYFVRFVRSTLMVFWKSSDILRILHYSSWMVITWNSHTTGFNEKVMGIPRK